VRDSTAYMKAPCEEIEANRGYQAQPTFNRYRPYDFLLIVNSNFGLTVYRLRDVMSTEVENRHFRPLYSDSRPQADMNAQQYQRNLYIAERCMGIQCWN